MEIANTSGVNTTEANNTQNLTIQNSAPEDSSVIKNLNEYLNQKYKINTIIKKFQFNGVEEDIWKKLSNADNSTKLTDYEILYTNLLDSLNLTNSSKIEELKVLKSVELELINILDIFKLELSDESNKRKVDQIDEVYQKNAYKQKYSRSAMVIENNGNYLFSGLSNSKINESNAGDVFLTSVLPTNENPQIPNLSHISPATVFPKSLSTRNSRRLVAPELISLTHNCSFAPTYDSSKATLSAEEASIFNRPPAKQVDYDLFAYEGIDIQAILDKIEKDEAENGPCEADEELNLPEISLPPKSSEAPEDLLRIESSVTIDDLIIRNQLNLIKLQLLQKFRHKHNIQNPTKQELEISQEFCNTTSELLLKHTQPKNLTSSDKIQDTIKKTPHYDPSFQGTVTRNDYAFFGNSSHHFAYPTNSGIEPSRRVIRQFNFYEPTVQENDDSEKSNDMDNNINESLNTQTNIITNGQSNGHLNNEYESDNQENGDGQDEDDDDDESEDGENDDEDDEDSEVDDDDEDEEY
ncbi:hypothetical protein CONCODRAFT_5735 [Conidiobolus coronatus NRRL 28638]|uniref:Uncharacterized protein n=1 Tax=Conidiobolus coronatus (strain ATCC 28846 / CBS 209.66 / NRRL 28638) TaxID=796925 RepID=A0A137P994_CONC2|nr:hypothetical protein CONCODRAFT_5735 [Conidiobolus coronatus NRRL 28638]|eukprot:KXN71575.1 hypothetical protein CONCODRAFT_5735 [Conidiobolus coronatus NRRL 28638]